MTKRLIPYAGAERKLATDHRARGKKPAAPRPPKPSATEPASKFLMAEIRRMRREVKDLRDEVTLLERMLRKHRAEMGKTA